MQFVETVQARLGGHAGRFLKFSFFLQSEVMSKILICQPVENL